MSLSYEIRQVQHSDGRTIWRLYEQLHQINGKVHEYGIAAFDSQADAERFCRDSKKQINRHALRRQKKLDAEELQ